MAYPLDSEGFLTDLGCWDENFVYEAAYREGISLQADHWEVIYFLRDFYASYRTSPAIRALLKALKAHDGSGKWSSLTLHTLFPESPAVQAAKLAGLPKPARCI